eukprot:gene10036-19986_t
MAMQGTFTGLGGSEAKGIDLDRKEAELQRMMDQMRNEKNAKLEQQQREMRRLQDALQTAQTAGEKRDE